MLKGILFGLPRFKTLGVVSHALLACSLLAAPALPAWFDCSIARTVLEKTICSDPSLSRLDDTLGMAYMTALDSSADPAKVRKDQWKWLSRLRQGRSGKHVISQAYRERISALGKYPKYTWKTYRDSVMGFSVEYPGNRILAPGSDPGLFVLLVPGVEPEARTIEIKLINQAFDSANAKEGIFMAQDGSWFAYGDRCSGRPKAEAIRGKGWEGQSVEFGCAGAGNCGGTCFEALISDGSRSAYIFLPEPLSIYSRSLDSFRFLEPR